MIWYEKLRTKFWEIRSVGERYQTLRTSKNRLNEPAGEYTITKVSERTKLPESTIKKIESGGLDTPALIDVLLLDLGVPRQIFDKGPDKATKVPEKQIRVITTPPSKDKPFIPVNPAQPTLPTMKTEKPAAKKAEIPEVKFKKGATINVINHHFEHLIISITEDSISIFSNAKENIKKGEFVGMADDVGGTSLKARTTPVKVGG